LSHSSKLAYNFSAKNNTHFGALLFL
jgi:hypothetical protein